MNGKIRNLKHEDAANCSGRWSWDIVSVEETVSYFTDNPGVRRYISRWF